MAIFRGTGGSGNSTDDSIVSAVTEQAGIATTKAGEAATSASNANTSATNAATSATTASTKATEANTAKDTAEDARDSAQTYRDTALQAASTAGSHATAAEASAQTANNSSVQTVAGISTEVQNVNNIRTEIQNVDTIKTDVTTVSGISSNVTTVAADASDIGTVATNIANVNNVGDNIANVNAVHSNASNINTVAADASDIGTVSSNISNVNTVAGISSDVTTVAGLESKMDTVIADASDIGAVANNIGDVSTVAGINSEVDTVAGISAKVTTVADNITDVQNADTNAANASASASQAANSASAAGASASTASTKATEASNSATAASNSATTATTKATEAAGSATTATTKATEASTSATNAATSATTATTKASEAASSATAASGSATTATTKASEASVSAASAATSATDASNAENAWSSFYATYLGSYSAPPTVDVQGNALQTGAFYYDTGTGSNTVGLYVYNGSSWVYSTNYNNVTAPYSLSQDLATNGNDISFGVNAKANFGASDDLQIYHDGSNNQSYIAENGLADLLITTNGAGIKLQKNTGEIMIKALTDGAVTLYHDNQDKLTTTATGIDVTGTVTIPYSGTNANSFYQGNALGYGKIVPFNNNGMLAFDTNYSSGGGYKFSYNGSEKMRIDSSGHVGVGTTSPSYPLHVKSTSGVCRILAETAGITDSSQASIQLKTPTDNWQLVMKPVDSALQFYDGGAGAERMRIDSSGNVLVGKTSDSINTVGGQLNADGLLVATRGGGNTAVFNRKTSDGTIAQFRKDNTPVGSIVTKDGDIYLGTGDTGLRFYDDGDSIYPVNSSTGSGRDAAVDLGRADGTTFRFKDLYLSGQTKGGSGTAGAPTYAFTSDTNMGMYRAADNNLGFSTSGGERMRIDSSGNLLVGTTSSALASTSTNEGIALNADHTMQHSRNGVVQYINRITTDGTITDFRKDGTTVGSIQARGGDLVIGTGDTGVRFNDASNALQPHHATNVTDGTIDIGLSSHRFKDLHLSGNVYTDEGFYGNRVWNEDNSSLRFATNNSEKMRIDESGNLLVGKTGQSLATVGVEARNYGLLSSTRDQAAPLNLNRKTSDGSIAEFYKDGSIIGSISVTSSATAYNTSSDERLKENIQDADDAGSKIDAIQVRQFDWKSDGSHQDYGVVAQELLEVAPEAVTEGETEDDMMSVDYSKLVPTLIKEIQTLRNRVAQLENN